VGGTKPYEGTILTRNQSSLIDRWKLDGDSKGIEKWYLLETNYDHWLPPPPDDDRRTPAMKAMNATTQEKLNDETLFAVLRMKPVCNK
jgi:N-acylethanolamine-hydrolysing acid amidase